jgi:putative ABC transport system permease protein
MKFSDLFYISFQNFKNRKSRVFFTILGVAIAIAVVLSLVSFGYGLQKSLLDQITTSDALLSIDIAPSDPQIIHLDQHMIEVISAIDHVVSVSPEATFSGRVSYGGVNSEAAFNVISSDFFSLDGKSPIAGRFFESTDSKQVVVSAAVAQLFQLTPESILGKQMTFAIPMPNPETGVIEDVSFGQDYTIVGVLEGQDGIGEVYVHAQEFTAAPITFYQFAKVKVVDQKNLEEVRNQLIDRGFIVSSLSDVVSQANKIFGVVQIALGVFGTFALIVAAIGLVNTMTISLLERTNEIGIMRAIGASPADIRKIFLVESIVIGFIGGICGIVIGVIGSELLNWGFNLLATSYGGSAVRLFVYPFWFILFIIILSTFVGLAGGVWPAKRAATMNPLQALRYK